MRNINASFFEMKGGKTSFRKLAELMKTSTLLSKEYENFLNFLKSEAKRYDCTIEDLELSDDDALYEIEW